MEDIHAQAASRGCRSDGPQEDKGGSVARGGFPEQDGEPGGAHWEVHGASAWGAHVGLMLNINNYQVMLNDISIKLIKLTIFRAFSLLKLLASVSIKNDR